jgi:arylsulfatase A-like enzyme
MIRDPKDTKGKRIDAMVQNTDLLATLLPMLGIEPHENEGVDLRPLMRGEVAAAREYAYSGAFGVRSSIRTDKWKLIDNHGERETELFNIQDDPFELDNLAGKEPVLRDRLHRRLWEFGLKWSRQKTWRDKPVPGDAPPKTR